MLAMFLPLIISSGGNSGSQATTLVIRAMALGEVTLRDWWRVMRRRSRAGFFSRPDPRRHRFFPCASRSWQQYLHRFVYGPHTGLVALTVGIALVGVVLVGLALRLDAAIPAAAFRRRSSHFIRAVRGHARRCDGADDLFQRRAADHARNDVVG